MVGRNICGPPVPSTLLLLFHHFGVLNFEKGPRFCKICTLSENKLCLEKNSGGLCNRIVLAAHWIDRVPGSKEHILFICSSSKSVADSPCRHVHRPHSQ